MGRRLQKQEEFAAVMKEEQRNGTLSADDVHRLYALDFDMKLERTWEEP